MKKHAVTVTQTYTVKISATVFFTEDMNQPADLDLTHKWVRKACDKAMDTLNGAFTLDLGSMGQEIPYSVDSADLIDDGKEIREYEIEED